MLNANFANFFLLIDANIDGKCRVPIFAKAESQSMIDSGWQQLPKIACRSLPMMLLWQFCGIFLPMLWKMCAKYETINQFIDAIDSDTTSKDAC